MHSALVFLLIVATTFATQSHSDLASWSQFKLTHKKAYSSEEEVLRYEIFSTNLKKIEEHNDLYDAGLTTYKKGINQFTDMTEKEFNDFLKSSGPLPLFDESMEVYQPNSSLHIPESLDYRDYGALNPVRDQGLKCQSCWAFSAVASLESINFLRNNVLLSLSEQNILDCSGLFSGCTGGYPYTAFNYIKRAGIESRDEYPYTETKNVCKFDPLKSVITISGQKTVSRGNEEDLKSAVAEVGPVTASVDASEFRTYQSGIFYSKKSKFYMNHAVVIVGYGSENGQDYWIARNSWGEQWGEGGYIRIARNAGNQFGIVDKAVYPIL